MDFNAFLTMLIDSKEVVSKQFIETNMSSFMMELVDKDNHSETYSNGSRTIIIRYSVINNDLVRLESYSTLN